MNKVVKNDEVAVKEIVVDNMTDGFDPAEVEEQIKGLSTFKKTRNNIQVNESLKNLQITAKGDKNIMPDIIHCVKT